MVGVVNAEQGRRSRSLSLGNAALLKLLFKQRLCLHRSQSGLPDFSPSGYKKPLQTSGGFSLAQRWEKRLEALYTVGKGALQCSLIATEISMDRRTSSPSMVRRDIKILTPCPYQPVNMDLLLLGNKIRFWWREKEKAYILYKPTAEAAKLWNCPVSSVICGKGKK